MLLLGKQRKILVYALIRVASIRQLPLFGQKRTLVKINKFGYRNVPKKAKKGVNKFFCAFGAKLFGNSDQALIRTLPKGSYSS